MAEPTVVHVEVYGQKYPIKTALDPRYVEQLASFVESRMELAAKTSPSSDAVGLAAVLASARGAGGVGPAVGGRVGGGDGGPEGDKRIRVVE